MTTYEPLVLVIEDELPIRRFLRATLPNHGYRLTEAPNATDGLREATMHPPDLVILDLGLPDLDGLEVTQRLRAWSRVPIIILSARGQEQDKIGALDAGADDYLTKPFGTGELLARMRVALRHATRNDDQAEDNVFSLDGLRVDFARRQVWVNDLETHLTPIEYKLLTVFIHNIGRVVTHQQLLKAVWGPTYATEAQYLRVYVGQLRRKIEADAARPRYLLTEPGVGYRLQAE